MYKLYCFILNDRMSYWCEVNKKIVGSTIDYLTTLTNLIDTRKKMKQSTFCAFIDFRKAYDCIDRDILWAKFDNIGITGKLLGAVKSLYVSVASCVQLNTFTTDWFDVTCGLRQGCCLSPLLFNLYISDLALHIKSLGKGTLLGEDLISILLYADDIVLVADKASNLPYMLNCLNDWCGSSRMSVSTSKSNIMHFRPNTVPRTTCQFKCDTGNLKVTDKYTYFDSVLTHFIQDTLKGVLAKSADPDQMPHNVASDPGLHYFASCSAIFQQKHYY